MKRGIEDEVNSLLQVKGSLNMEATGEVKLLHALKLGGQEGGNRLEIMFPRRFGGLGKRLPNMLCVQAIESRPIWGVINYVLYPRRRTP